MELIQNTPKKIAVQNEQIKKMADEYANMILGSILGQSTNEDVSNLTSETVSAPTNAEILSAEPVIENNNLNNPLPSGENSEQIAPSNSAEPQTETVNIFDQAVETPNPVIQTVEVQPEVVQPETVLEEAPVVSEASAEEKTSEVDNVNYDALSLEVKQKYEEARKYHEEARINMAMAEAKYEEALDLLEKLNHKVIPPVDPVKVASEAASLEEANNNMFLNEQNSFDLNTTENIFDSQPKTL